MYVPAGWSPLASCGWQKPCPVERENCRGKPLGRPEDKGGRHVAMSMGATRKHITFHRSGYETLHSASGSNNWLTLPGESSYILSRTSLSLSCCAASSRIGQYRSPCQEPSSTRISSPSGWPCSLNSLLASYRTWKKSTVATKFVMFGGRRVDHKRTSLRSFRTLTCTTTYCHTVLLIYRRPSNRRHLYAETTEVRNGGRIQN